MVIIKKYANRERVYLQTQSVLETKFTQRELVYPQFDFLPNYQSHLRMRINLEEVFLC